MTDVTVRTADPSDAAEILAVKQAAIEELAATEYTPEELAAWAPDDRAVADYESAIEADAFEVLVAEIQNQIAGYGVLNAAEASIDGLFVRPFWSRSGVATRLLSQLEMSAALAGCETLSAVVSLNAVPFYRQAGYRRREDRSRTIGDVELDFAFMRKDLSEDELIADQPRE